MAAPIRTSSFQKRSKTGQFHIPGTQVSPTNSGLNVSTGISSLDAILDGGLPIGSLCIIEEDEYGSYAKVVTKYFLAEGIVHGNYLFYGTCGENPWDTLNRLPSQTKEPPSEQVQVQNRDELKIAWRYENLKFDDNMGKSGLSYDLSNPINLTENHKSKIICWDGLNIGSGPESSSLPNVQCSSLIKGIVGAIDQWKLSSGASNMLRIVVSAFGSPYWQLNEAHSAEFTSMMIFLKSILQSSNAVAIVTLPHRLLDPVAVARCHSIADVVYRLKSLREDRHLQDLIDVHGILEVKKITNMHSLKPILGQSGTTTYGFKATKRKFKIEKIHLPPSLESEKSDVLDNQAPSCSSGTAKSKLDF